MIGERAVLLRVEHFEQSARRVAAKIRAHLVNLVEQDDGVVRLHAAQRLNDSPRQRAHVGAAVPTNLRLVAQSAQRDARELPPQRVGDALAQRGLAHAGRADEAKERSLQILLQLEDRDEVQQPLLHLLQPVMLLVEDALGGLDVDGVLGRFAPGQSKNPVEIGACDRVFRNGGRHLTEPLQFLDRDLEHICWQLRLLDLRPEIVHLRRHRIALAQLALDGPHLLAQKEIALALGHRAGHVILNLGTEREHLQLAIEQGLEPLQACLHVGRFKQLLAFVEREIEVGRDEISQRAGGLAVERRDLHLIGQRGRELDDLLELPERVARQRGDLDRIDGDILEMLDLRAEIGRLRFVSADAHSPQTLDQHAHRVVGKFEHLEHARPAGVFVKILGQGIAHLGLLLEHERQQPVALHHVVDEPDALRRIDEERCDHAGEDHDVRQPEHGQRFRQRLGHGLLRGHVALGLVRRGAQDANEFSIG